MPELRKLHTDDDYWYTDCELAVLNKVFGDDWRIINKNTEGNYDGETTIEIEIRKKWDVYKFSYFWGSCSGCDTLQGYGPEAACQMIFENLQDVIKEKNNNGD